MVIEIFFTGEVDTFNPNLDPIAMTPSAVLGEVAL